MPPKFHDPYVLIIKMGRPSPSGQGEFGPANFVDLHSNRIIRQTTGPHARAPSSLDSRRRDAVLKNRQRRPDKIVNSTCYQRNIGINLSSVFSLLVPFDFFLIIHILHHVHSYCNIYPEYLLLFHYQIHSFLK